MKISKKKSELTVIHFFDGCVMLGVHVINWKTTSPLEDPDPGLGTLTFQQVYLSPLSFFLSLSLFVSVSMSLNPTHSSKKTSHKIQCIHCFLYES